MSGGEAGKGTHRTCFEKLSRKEEGEAKEI